MCADDEIAALGGLCWRCGIDNTLAIVAITGVLKVVLCESCRVDPAVQRDLGEYRELARPIAVRGQPWPCARGDHEHCPAINTHRAIVETELCPCECHTRELERMAK